MLHMCSYANREQSIQLHYITPRQVLLRPATNGFRQDKKEIKQKVKKEKEKRLKNFTFRTLALTYVGVCYGAYCGLSNILPFLLFRRLVRRNSYKGGSFSRVGTFSLHSVTPRQVGMVGDCDTVGRR